MFEFCLKLAAIVVGYDQFVGFRRAFCVVPRRIGAIDIIPANFTRKWTPGEINDYIMF